MSAAEFAEWGAFDSIDPIGLDRMDWLFAMLTSTIVGMMTTKGTPPTPRDVLAIWDEHEHEQRQAKRWKMAALEAELLRNAHG